jgi:hypothetical protein
MLLLIAVAVAMANIIGKDVAKGKIYNIQDTQSVTFQGLAELCAQVSTMHYAIRLSSLVYQ